MFTERLFVPAGDDRHILRNAKTVTAAHLSYDSTYGVTTDIDADIAQLQAAGVLFLSAEPGAVAGPNGTTTRYICFRDPDGTVLELVDMGAT